MSRADPTANFVIRAVVCEIPRVYISAYTSLVLPILLYASSVWRPLLKSSVTSLELFQRRICLRIARKCDVDPCAIFVKSISEVCDEREWCFAHLFLENPEFSWFFVGRSTSTRSRLQFLAPLARNNTVHNSFRWRLSRRLSVWQYKSPHPR